MHGAGAGASHRNDLLQIVRRTQAETDRVLRLDVGGVPMGAIADRGNGRLGRADQLGNLPVRHFRVILQQPGDGVRPVLPLGDRGVAGALGLGLGHGQVRLGGLQAGRGVAFAAVQFRLRQLTGLHGVEPLHSDGDLVVGDGLNFKLMQAAEIGDLPEREGRIFHKPNGSGLRHQRTRHGYLPIGVGFRDCSVDQHAPARTGDAPELRCYIMTMTARVKESLCFPGAYSATWNTILPMCWLDSISSWASFA